MPEILSFEGVKKLLQMKLQGNPLPEDWEELITAYASKKTLGNIETPPLTKEDFFEGEGRTKKFLAGKMAEDILREFQLVTFRDTDEIWMYKNGIYVPGAEPVITENILERIDEDMNGTKLANVLLHIKARTYINREDMDGEKGLINMKNGIYNFISGEFLPHTPKIFFSRKINVDHDGLADCPTFKKFVCEVVPAESISMIQEFFGYCFYNDYHIQRAFMLIGDGANGKSTLLSVLENMMGDDNISGTSLQDFEKDRFAAAELYGKLANICADLPKNALKDTGKFKMLTGGDRIQAREIYKSPFRFRNTAKMIFATNKPPIVYDDTYAFIRRWEFVIFPYTFKPEREMTSEDKVNPYVKLRDPSIGKLLENELSGIFNWAMEGLKRLLSQGEFTTTMTSDEKAALYDRLSNPILAFLYDCTEQASEDSITKTDFYKVYVSYCQENKYPAVQDVSFGKEIKKICPYVSDYRPRHGEKRETGWTGIKLTEYGTKLLQKHQGSNIYVPTVSLEELQTLDDDQSTKITDYYKKVKSIGQGGHSSTPILDNTQQSVNIVKVIDINPDHPDHNLSTLILQTLPKTVKASYTLEAICSSIGVPIETLEEKFNDVWNKLSRDGVIYEARFGEWYVNSSQLKELGQKEEKDYD